MIRGVSGRIVLLVLAIAFVIGLLVTRNQKPQVEDPLAEAQEKVKETLGVEVERVSPALQPAGPVDPAMVSRLSGLRVRQVVKGSPAEGLGLRVGDQVLAVNEATVWHVKQLDDELGKAVERGPVRLMLSHNGVYRSVMIGGRAGPSGGRAGTRVPARSPAGG